jgi:hypothetical protein
MSSTTSSWLGCMRTSSLVRCSIEGTAPFGPRFFQKFRVKYSFGQGCFHIDFGVRKEVRCQLTSSIMRVATSDAIVKTADALRSQVSVILRLATVKTVGGAFVVSSTLRHIRLISVLTPRRNILGFQVRESAVTGGRRLTAAWCGDLIVVISITLFCLPATVTSRGSTISCCNSTVRCYQRMEPGRSHLHKLRLGCRCSQCPRLAALSFRSDIPCWKLDCLLQAVFIRQRVQHESQTWCFHCFHDRATASSSSPAYSSSGIIVGSTAR